MTNLNQVFATRNVPPIWESFSVFEKNVNLKTCILSNLRTLHIFWSKYFKHIAACLFKVLKITKQIVIKFRLLEMTHQIAKILVFLENIAL